MKNKKVIKLETFSKSIFVTRYMCGKSQYLKIPVSAEREKAEHIRVKINK